MLSAAGALAVCLAAWGIREVLNGWNWFYWSVAAVLVVFVIGQVGSRLLKSVSWTSVIQLAAVFYVAAHAAVPHTLAFGVLPTLDTFHAIPQQVMTTYTNIRQLHPPIDSNPSMDALMVILIGLSAVCIDILVSDLRSPAAAGLVLFLLHVIPMAVLVKPASAWSFVAAAGGFVLLLWAHQRQANQEWSHSTPRGNNPFSVPVAAIVAGACCAVAVIVPNMFSHLSPDDRFWRVSGGGVITIANPVFDLRDSLTDQSSEVMFTYETQDTEPAPVRLAVVDTYDGVSFAPPTETLSRENKVQSGLPTPAWAPQSVTNQATVTSTFELAALNGSAFLPVTDLPQKVNINGRWLYDDSSYNILGSGQTTAPGLKYTVESLKLTYTREQLAQAQAPSGTDFSRWTALPGTLPTSVRDEAKKVAGTGTAYEKAVAIQQYFRSDGGFTYSLNVPETSDNAAIEEFLVRKTGFCVHYASTMALMARAEGIPARVVTGFLPGKRDPNNNQKWIVSGKDAHAWPELYFDKFGWVRFEPTPTNQLGTLPDWTVEASQEENQPTPAESTPTPEPTTQQEQNNQSQGDPSQLEGLLPEINDPTFTPNTTTPEEKGLPGWMIPSIICVLVLLVTPSIVLLWRQRRRRLATDPDSLWQSMLLDLADVGVTFAPSATEQDVAEQLKKVVPQAHHGSVGVLCSAVQDARYSGVAVATRPTQLRQEAARVVAEVAAQQTSRQRLLARLFPGVARRF